MKVQVIQQNDIAKKNSKPQFKGGADAFLRYLATNQAVGANGIDLVAMVIPRTTTDLVSRGPAAGLETARREASGTINHTLVGVFGIFAGSLIAAAMGINRKFNAGANKIMTAPETLNILAENKASQVKNNTHQIEYLKETLKNVKAFNPSANGADENGFVKLSQETIDDVARILDYAINDKETNFSKWSKKDTADSMLVVMNKIIADTGAESRYVLESAAKDSKSNTNLKTLLEDIFKVSESFNKKPVMEAFEEQIRNNNGIDKNKYIQALTKFNKRKSAAGFAISTAVGMSIQPLNIYLTKKKTGSDGFVGVEGREKDKSLGFLGLRIVSSAAFFGMVLATLQTGLKGFMDKMSFKGFWPTIPQLKGIYGLTIISRLLATRDKDELREALTKDTLGFLSWLVLGDFVNKITAESLDKSVMNRTAEVSKKSWASRIFNSSLKTRDEILIETLTESLSHSEKQAKITKKVGDKTVAKTFKELLSDLDQMPESVKVKAKKRLGTLNKAQLAGYLFSGLVLGLGIPNLNIYITNKLDKQRKAKAAAKAEAEAQEAVA